MDGLAQLIILRGNSGSGKTTTGKALQTKFGRGTMLISQDLVRRELLFVNDGPNPESSLNEIVDIIYKDVIKQISNSNL